METKEKRPAQGNRPKTGVKPSAQRPKKTASSQNRSTPATRNGSRPAAPKRPAAPRKRRSVKAQPAVDVVYTQPVPFNKNRLVLNLLIVGAVVLALIFGMSIFFKVDIEKVTISGANKYTEMQIRDASGLKDGENLLSISTARTAKNIQNALPYVNKVRIGIKLPDTVKIEIVEFAVVYAVECTDGSWWLMNSEGKLLEKTNDADAGLHTKIVGVQITDPVLGERAVAAQPVETAPEEETVPVTVLAQEQLDLAVNIVTYMESAGIIGEAASVDVSDLSDIQVWYEDRFQVLLGDEMELNYKVRLMKSTMDEMGEYQGGVLDISFSIRPGEAVFTPSS